MKKSLIVLLILTGLGCSPKTALYRQNAEFRYDKGRTFAYDLRRENDSLHVFLKLADRHLFQSGSRPLKLYYVVNLSYERDEVLRRDTVAFFDRRLQVFPDFAFAHFKVPIGALPLPAVLQVQVQPAAMAAPDGTWMDIPLTQESISKPFILTDSSQQVPLFRQYIHTAETVYFQFFGAPADLVIKRFAADFPAALPPFSAAQQHIAPVLSVLATWEAAGQQPLQLQEPGLYQLETGKARTALLVAERPFPNLTTARDLIEPLIYLTSAKERAALYAAAAPKLALDRFWLDVAGQNKDKARQLIKTYYGRVKDANQFFSSHKAGWLTDRGMVYIIFGKPDAVRRGQLSEEWIYHRPKTGGPDIKFNFNKKPNTFTQNHYEVVRHPDYEFLWYSTVEKWRKGIILVD